MIRCHKCGYSNQLNAKNCVKCRHSLVKEEVVVPAAADPSHLNKKTIVVANADDVPWDQPSPVVVPVQRNRPNGGVQTVRRVVPDHRSCYLVALSVDEEKELRKIDLKGDTISLDREVLDPGNTSISRNGHASIYQKEGSWYLENMTALKTTFIQVNQPLKLTDGDIVLLGDSLFKFKLG
jgi:hypothetical protein